MYIPDVAATHLLLPCHSIIVLLLQGYFQYAGGFEPRKAFDITATLPNDGRSDPMFVIEAIKSKNKA